MRTKEDAGYAIDTGTPIRTSLSRGASRRNLPVLAAGLMILLTTGLVLPLYLIFLYLTEKEFFHFMLALFICPLSVSSTLALGRWLYTFFAAYGFEKAEFSPDGLITNSGLISYDRMRIRFYRGTGDILEPCAGLLVLYAGGEYPRFFGSERENYFILPFLLEAWAKNHFTVLPTKSIPESAEELKDPGSAWVPPSGFDFELMVALTKYARILR